MEEKEGEGKRKINCVQTRFDLKLTFEPVSEDTTDAGQDNKEDT